jgi:hypothetical protein
VAWWKDVKYEVQIPVPRLPVSERASTTVQYAGSYHRPYGGTVVNVSRRNIVIYLQTELPVSTGCASAVHQEKNSFTKLGLIFFVPGALG